MSAWRYANRDKNWYEETGENYKNRMNDAASTVRDGLHDAKSTINDVRENVRETMHDARDSYETPSGYVHLGHACIHGNAAIEWAMNDILGPIDANHGAITSNYDACASRCNQDVKCKAFEVAQGKCWFKSGYNRKSLFQSEYCSSYVKDDWWAMSGWKEVYETDYRIARHELGRVHTSSPSKCMWL